jgi:phosphoglycolate phosphatase-like HAD superfamily hydrolase
LTSKTLVLWDIDNTLLYTGGAGMVGMRRAFADLYGIEDSFQRIEFSGRTDTAIFHDATAEHGMTPDAARDDMPRFIDAYVPHLTVALHEVKGGALKPGVRPLLDALAARDDVVQGLGTGNFRRAAEVKVRHFEIDEYFPGCVGGFGEDSHDRHEVIALAIARLGDGTSSAGRVVVIGDTPHDVTAAKANGAFALAVATGRDSVGTLVGAGADVALADLSDVERVLGIIAS